MEYTRIQIEAEDIASKELWIGLLATLPEIIGTEELNDESLLAYTQDWDLIEEQIGAWSKTFHTQITLSQLPNQNWNASWESNFEPVILPGFVSVRAHFHPPIPGVQYDIKITPKMSFGTGHHATTKLMMEQMRLMQLQDKQVFDFGTGTGILAILAEFLGAKHIEAIDIDEWSYENAVENIATNACEKINIEQADGTWLDDKTDQFDIILANINRHILLENMNALHRALRADGKLLLSGILKLQDTAIIVEKASNVGFKFEIQTEENGWSSILFGK